MSEYTQLAEKLFTGGTILFGIAVLLCKTSWSTLMGFLANYPEARMPFKFNPRNLPAKKQLLLKESQLLIAGIFFFGVASFASLVSTWQSASYMLGMGNPGFFAQDYAVGKWSLMICVFSLILGFVGLGSFYGGEFKRIIKGYHPISDKKSRNKK